MGVGDQQHTPAALLLEKSTGTHCTGCRVDWPAWVHKNSPPQELNPQTIQHVADRCTDYASPGHLPFTLYIIQRLTSHWTPTIIR
jgi:hypothetical protein